MPKSYEEENLVIPENAVNELPNIKRSECYSPTPKEARDAYDRIQEDKELEAEFKEVWDEI